MLYTKHATVTSTAEVVVLTVPAGFVAHVSYLLVANNGGSTNACTLYFDDGTNELHLLDAKNISSKASEEFYRGIFVMQPGEQVKAQTGSSGDVEFAVTLDLLEAPASFVNFS
tara:strand:- start:8714 stop:9052 length:339 start_codon:yes stop_codon:yes gene_type:complete